MSASWLLLSTYLIWILSSKLILSNSQSRETLSVLDTCLIAGLRPLLIIFDHGFVVFQNVQLRHTVRRMCVGGYIIHIIKKNSTFCPLLTFWVLGLDEESHQFPGCHCGWVGQCCWLNVIPQSLCPEDQQQVTHPYAIQHPEK